jgi:peptidyl-prolyl cis-trans isomerase D
VFSDDAVKNKRNTEAIEIKPNTLVSARILEHKPASVEPFEAVSSAIEKLLVREMAVARAEEAGKAELSKLQAGDGSKLSWGTVRQVSRMHAPNLSPEARAAVFSAKTTGLPAYAGAKVPGGYALYRIGSVKPYSEGAADAAPRALALRQQYSQITAQEEMVGWLAALRQRYPVKINNEVLERK